MDTGSDLASLWERQAAQWMRLGPPFKPCTEDVAITERLLAELPRRHGATIAALLLGVTPELVSQRWPDNSIVLATDISRSMIGGVWPGRSATTGRQHATQADWMSLPIRGRSIDIVLGDGAFNQNAAGEAPRLLRSLERVLTAGAHLAVRVFVRPERRERPEGVWEQLVDRQIANFQLFKFRLLVALSDERGDVPVARAYEWFAAHCSSIPALAVQLDWPLEIVSTINAYRDQRTTYWFPTVDETRELTASCFEEVACERGTYELAEQCPTFVWRHRG